jgi:DNA-binding transcriptional regulator YiaG
MRASRGRASLNRLAVITHSEAHAAILPPTQDNSRILRDKRRRPMPDIASVLKSEIERLARKQIRSEVQAIRKASAAHRSQIAALKRRVQALESALKRRPSASERQAHTDGTPTKATRFSAKSLKSQRRRLGLSAANVGLLVGTTGQTIYNWEAGLARPRAAHLQAIASLRKLGRKQAAAIVAERR